jgi:hypothetical protein
VTLPAALKPLEAYRQFIVYRLVPSTIRPGKTDKIPRHYATGYGASLMDPASWTDYATAAAAVTGGKGHGVGFVFTPSDPFWFVDIDGAFVAGAWSPVATEIYNRLRGAAVEVSQSNTGLHIIGSGVVPDHRCKNIPLNLELYHTDRFVALTGNAYDGGTAAADLTPAIGALAATYFPAPVAGEGMPDGWTSEPVADWSGPVDDAELLRLALNAKSAAGAFGGGVTFADLWNANEDVLAARWPGTTGPYGASEADAALAGHLAFWTGKNCDRIESLMRQSALARDKWDRASGYLEPTILRACAVVRNVCQQPAVAPVKPEILAALAAAPMPVGPIAWDIYVAPAQFAAFFIGCTYVVGEDKIYTPGGELLKSSQFDTVYGGHEFIMDAEGRKTTTSAWEAFRLNRVWRSPIADVLCFRPEAAPGAIIADEGRTLLNTYVPIQTLRIKGDASRFVELVAKLLPNGNDAEILKSYMAALIQNPGRKFQWWPVLQGVQGNGKTLILSVISHAVGHRYTHLVNPEAMAKTGGQFNSWIMGNLFVGVEEIYVNNRRDFLESFKSTVTNKRIGLEGKGTNQTTGDNRVNGILLTNHRDGVPIADSDRRYAILWTAQQSVDDLHTWGMDGNYFPDLYDWLDGKGAYENLGMNYGYAVVNEFLASYVPAVAFNPAGLCQRAPETSSRAEALAASLGRAEQEILEAIGEGRPGFCGGWVSSNYLDALLDKLRATVPLSKRRDMMRNLGYDWHPGLKDGRVSSLVSPDRMKPRLYVKAGHLALNLTTPHEIAKAYTAAQDSEGAARAFG